MKSFYWFPEKIERRSSEEECLGGAKERLRRNFCLRVDSLLKRRIGKGIPSIELDVWRGHADFRSELRSCGPSIFRNGNREDLYAIFQGPELLPGALFHEPGNLVQLP